MNLMMNGPLPIPLPMTRITEFCRRYGAARLSLFGSVIRDDFTSESDVDVFVEFRPGTRIGLIGMANMQAELREAVGRRVDLRTPADLSRYFRDEAVARARLLHAA